MTKKYSIQYTCGCKREVSEGQTPSETCEKHGKQINDEERGELKRINDGIHAIVAALRNDNPKTALLLARTIMYGGSVHNPLDLEKYRE